MITQLKLLVVLGVLFGSILVHARPCGYKDACFEWRGESKVGTWANGETYDNNSTGAYEIVVNNRSYRFLHHVYQAPTWIIKSIVDPRVALQDGLNEINFFITGQNLKQVRYTLNYYPPNRSPILICNGDLGNDVENRVTCTARISLNELDPNLQREIDQYKREINEWNQRFAEEVQNRPRLNEEDAALEKELKEILDRNQVLVDAIGRVSGADFDDLELHELAEIIAENPDIERVFVKLKADLAEIRQRVQDASIAAEAESQQVLADIQQQFQLPQGQNVPVDFQEGGDFRNFREDDFQQAGAQQDHVDVELIVNTSNETVEKLRAALNRGNATEFFAIFDSWNQLQIKTNSALRNSQGSAALLHAANQAHQTVIDYARDQVDTYGFFRRSRVPDQIKRLIGTRIREWNPEYSRELTEELNSWQDGLSPNQEKVLTQIEAFGDALKLFEDPRLQAERQDEVEENMRGAMRAAFLEGSEKLIQAVRAAGEDQPGGEGEDLAEFEEQYIATQTCIHLAKVFGEVLIGLTPLGVAQDFYETIYGVSPLTHEELGIGQRVVSATSGIVGVLSLGSSNFVKVALKSIVKIGSKIKTAVNQAIAARNARRLEETARQVERVVDSAGQLGIKTKEAFKDLFDVSKHLGNEVGAVGNGVEDLIKAAGKVTQPVANMKEFFQTGFGNVLKNASEKTSKIFQGQKIHKVTENVNGFKHLKKGDYFYLDNLHKDHIEVFTSTGKFKQVINLDGTINVEKTAKAIGRTINVN